MCTGVILPCSGNWHSTVNQLYLKLWLPQHLAPKGNCTCSVSFNKCLDRVGEVGGRGMEKGAREGFHGEGSGR